ncbi:MAG: hypothetical protein M1830_001922 [Pleopsidium flavum]|nr:MAG: hypothetical protein M1830_001922 [Pleopsidium flavum]
MDISKVKEDLDGLSKLPYMPENAYKLFMRYLKTRFGPAKVYQLVRYRGVHKWTYARIAEKLNIPNSGELSRLYKRARRLLEKHLPDEYDSEMDVDTETYIEENVLDSEDELHVAG